MPSSEGNREDGIQTLRRAAAALDEIATEPGRLRQVDFEERLGLAKSTTRRLLVALTSIGYTSTDKDGRFHLGSRLLGLAGADSAQITSAFRPTLERIAVATDETVDLSILRGQQMWFIDQIQSPHRLRAVSAVGMRFALDDTANGRAAQAVLRGAAGEIAFDLDEHTPGISAAGIAGRATGGQIVAISVPAPTQRFLTNRETIVEALKQAAPDFS
ncbi:MAG: IclR family transcriptional regulator [Mycobacterium sp.]